MIILLKAGFGKTKLLEWTSVKVRPWMALSACRENKNTTYDATERYKRAFRLFFCTLCTDKQVNNRSYMYLYQYTVTTPKGLCCNNFFRGLHSEMHRNKGVMYLSVSVLSPCSTSIQLLIKNPSTRNILIMQIIYSDVYFHYK